MKKTPNNKRAEANQKRRETLIHAAIECFVNKGFHQTSIRDIATTAGVSLGNVYNHFANKEELICSIAEIEAEDVAQYESLLTQTKQAKQRITTFIDDYLNDASQPVSAVLMLEISAEATRNKTVFEQFIANRNTLVSALKAVIEQGVTEGEFDPSINPQEAAELILDAIEGISARSVLTQQTVSTQTRQALQQHIQKVLAK